MFVHFNSFSELPNKSTKIKKSELNRDNFSFRHLKRDTHRKILLSRYIAGTRILGFQELVFFCVIFRERVRGSEDEIE